MIDTVIGTHFIDKKLQPSTEYSYTVKAIDAAGNVSEGKYSAYSKNNS